MTKEQAAHFITALNSMQQFVPPFLFAAATQSDVATILVMMANGKMTCDLKPIPDDKKE